jgi:hypothetical protein
MKSITNDTPTVHMDGEERPATDIPTRCNNCGIPAMSYDHCEQCELARLENAIENQDNKTIRSILDSRIYSRTSGHTAQAHWEDNKATMWSDGFRIEAEEFIRGINSKLTAEAYVGFCEDEEYRKYCVVKW